MRSLEPPKPSRSSMPRLVLALVALVSLPFIGCATQGGGADTSPGDRASTNAAAWGEATRGFERLDGLLPVYRDAAAGRLLLELPAPDAEGLAAEVLYVEALVSGLGSNPVGLDRGQLGESSVLEIRRFGSRVLFERPNLRFRAVSDDVDELRATRESFASSVLWAADAIAVDAAGRSLVDIGPFVLRDAHDVVRSLRRAGQGEWRLDPDRSALDAASARAFPDNLVFEAKLTYATNDSEPGALVRQTAPAADALTLVQHVGLVRLPEPGYTPRPADPRTGFQSLAYADYAVPLDASVTQRRILRHRLEASGETDSAGRLRVREPIVYYVDRGAPEPIRTALLEGASWWADAFEAAGWADAYRVEILPEGVDPLDVRYHVIQWVHRATRGWSYGGAVVDPRTGEIVKGHVSLGSLRVRQDRMLIEGLVGTEATGSGEADDPIEIALARIRQLSAHEVGHTLGLTHNFAASSYDRGSVMDYPAPRVKRVRNRLDLSDAYGVGLGPWDRHTIAWGYPALPPSAEVSPEALEEVVEQGLAEGLVYVGDIDARSLGTADPRASLWDDGADPVDALEEALAVRELALERFGTSRLVEGEALDRLQEVLVPIYLYHRYQVDAAAKVLGGVESDPAVRGDGRAAPRIVDAARQRRALDVLVGLLDPAVLDLPEDVLRILPVRYGQGGPGVERFVSMAGPAFDPMAAAATAADLVLNALLEPQRLTRMNDLARRTADRRDDALPSAATVVDAIIEQSFGTGHSSPRRRAIGERVHQLVVEHLIRLADSPQGEPGAGNATPGVSGAVRAAATAGLEDIAARLDDSDRRFGTATAHERWLRDEIERFSERSWATSPVRSAPPAPPGSPIGQDAHGR